MEELIKIQSELKAPKGRKSSFGNYNYRSCEDILEAVKPILAKYDCELYLSDTMENIGGHNYIKATASLIHNGDTISVCAYARESETKKGMDDSQITGTSSSYARKYALNGLFLIDDTKDADTDEYHKSTAGIPDAVIEPKGSSSWQNIKDETAEPKQIGEKEAKLLIDLCARTEPPTDVQKMCKAYKVKSLDLLDEAQYGDALAIVKKRLPSEVKK